MHPSTPSGDIGTDLRDNATARHGDVDLNGDLVDQVATVTRLRAAITGRDEAAEERQLAAVCRMLRRGGFNEVSAA